MAIADAQVATTIINTAVGNGVNGAAFALNPLALLISWQVLFGTPPGTVTINLQASNDGVNFATIDTTTATVNSIRITTVSAKFIRINMSAVTGGDTFSVIVVPNSLGSGKSLFGGPAIIATQAAVVGNGADVTEDVLFSITLAARTFIQTGRSIQLEAWGHTGANANTKTIRARFGADNFVGLNAPVNNIDWYICLIVMRRSFSVFTRIGYCLLNGVSNNPQVQIPAIDETSPIVLQLTGQSSVATANDVTCEGLMLTAEPGIPGIV